MTAEDLRRMCLDLPSVEEILAWGEHPTFRVRGRTFAVLGADGDGSVRLKSTMANQLVLLGTDPETFSVPPHVGRHGWVRVDLQRVHPGDLHELVMEAWLLTAPKRLARTLEQR